MSNTASLSWTAPATSASGTNRITGQDKVNDILSGTTGNDVISGLSGADTMQGGLGDDYYYVDNLQDLVIENPNEGIDTLISYLPTTVLPDNVENLTLSGSIQKSGYGNSLANIIRGTSINNILDGGSGNDLLYGNGGNDVFMIRAGNGSDAIADFKAGSSSGTVVSLVGYDFTSFDQIKASMVQYGTTVIIDLHNGETLRFWNQTVENFTADDFKIGLDTSKWQLTFNDDFNTFDRFNGVDGTWATKQQWDGFAGYTNPSKAERQVYTDSEYRGVRFNTAPEPIGLNPFSIKDGTLEIKAGATPEEDMNWLFGRPYYSGLISTFPSFQQTYGYFEMRAELPVGQALWPAFWLLPADLGPITELDVFEALGQDLTSLLMTVHSGSTGVRTREGTSALTPDLSAGYHTFGVDWGPDFITWYLDGVAVATAATPPDMQNRPMYMIANLAIGGNWAGAPDATTLSGDPTFHIDYVRAYATENTVSTVAPLTRAGQSGIDYFQGTAYDDVLTGDPATGDGQNDMLYGAAGNDTLYGGVGDDILGGGQGNDTIDGGAGLDVALYNGDRARFLVVHNGDLQDSYTVIDRDLDSDSQGTDQLQGIETLRFRVIDRNTGDIISSSDVDLASTVQVDLRTNGAGGHDIAISDPNLDLTSFATSNPDTLVYAGSGTIALQTGIENLTATGLYGTTLIGNAASNVLNGGSGGAAFVGLAGDDILVGMSTSLTDAVDYSFDAANGGTGGVRVNLLTGTAIDGFGAHDTLMHIDNATGTNAADLIVGTGSANFLRGLDGNDYLGGGGGDDRLDGGAGDDTLDGGAGADTLIGGDGFNTADYLSALTGLVADLSNPLNNTGDAAGDRYQKITGLTGSFYDDRLTGSSVSDIIHGQNGNDLIFGLSGNDVVYGDGGDDALDGGLGTDWLDGGMGNDTLTGGGGKDTFLLTTALGSDNVDHITDFVAVDDTIQLDAEVFVGLAGGALAASAFKDLSTGPLDADDRILYDAGTGRLFYDADGSGSGAAVQFAILDTKPAITAADFVVTGTGTGDANSETGGGTGLNVAAGATADNDTLTGTSGNDLLDGGAGADTLTGLAGNDTYVVDHAGDIVTEALNEGTDTVETSLTSYTLTANVENLTYTGTAAFTGTGNELTNTILGSSGVDKLDGKAGADILVGGAGSDTYYVDNAGDGVVELANQGTDRVVAQVSYTLGDNVENLSLGTSLALSGTGNALANVIQGNAGANVLDGRGGADTLTGGAGTDTFVFRIGETDGDKVLDFAGAGVGTGDRLEFYGFGTGATLSQIGTTDSYTITADATHGGVRETFQLVGVTNLDLLTGSGHNDVMLFA